MAKTLSFHPRIHKTSASLAVKKMQLDKLILKFALTDFPGCPVVRTIFQWRGCGSDPWPEN